MKKLLCFLFLFGAAPVLAGPTFYITQSMEGKDTLLWPIFPEGTCTDESEARAEFEQFRDRRGHYKLFRADGDDFGNTFSKTVLSEMKNSSGQSGDGAKVPLIAVKQVATQSSSTPSRLSEDTLVFRQFLAASAEERANLLPKMWEHFVAKKYTNEEFTAMLREASYKVDGGAEVMISLLYDGEDGPTDPKSREVFDAVMGGLLNVYLRF